MWKHFRHWLNAIPLHNPIERRLGLFLDRFGISLRVALSAALAREQELERSRSALERRTAELEREVAERRRAEERLKQSEANLSALIENATEAIWSVDRNYRVLTFNSFFRDQFLITFGKKIEIGMELADLLPVDTLPELHSYWSRLYDRVLAGECLTDEQQYEIQGRLHYYNLSLYPIIADGKVTGVSVFSRDITERRRMEQALRDSEARMSLLIEQLPALLWITDRELRVTSAIGTGLAGLNLLPDQIVWKSLYDLLQTNSPEFPPILAHHRAVAGEAVAYEAEWRGRVFQAHVEPFLDVQGQIIGSITIALDITEQMRSARLREGQRSFFELLATGAPLDTALKALVRTVEAQLDGGLCSILLLDPDGQHLHHGAAPALPETYTRALDGAAIGPAAGSCGTAAFRGAPVIVADIATDPLWTEWRDLALSHGLRACWSVPFADSQGRVLGTFAIYYHEPRVPAADELEAVSSAAHLAAIAVERRHIETALREREQQYRLITESTGDLISMIDQQGRSVYLSPSYRAILGYDPAELINTFAFDFIHPDDLPVVAEQRAQFTTVGSGQATFRTRHADGSWRWIEANGTVIMHQGAPHVVMVGRDVTERRNLEAQLLQAQKMESVGRLAGGVAHDFNNLLTAITGNAELALTALPLADSARADLGEIIKAAERAAALTRQLLAFARKQIIEPRILNLNELIGDIDKLLHRLIGADIELITRTMPNLGSIKADPGQIEQLLVNLAVNARDAMPDGGKLTIETSNIVLTEAVARQHVGITAGPYVLLVVSDSGLGMSEAIKQHIFEPFFTTKGPGKGTGLGMATCYGIVKQHGGHIEVSSEPQHGATFKIYLPQVEPRSDPSALRLSDTGELPRGTETVLLAEDEPAVRALASRVLRTQGYTVLEAADGEAALHLARSQGTKIDLLLTDVVMPRMGGQMLAQQIVTLYPAIKVLFASGYVDNAIVHFGQLAPGVEFLQKPFSPSALARKVRSVLDL